MQNTPTSDYYKAHDDREYWQDLPQTAPQEFDFHPDFQSPPVIKKRKRHIFTDEERRRGYENAKLSVDARFPDARCQHGAALSHCLLRRLHPEFDAKAHHIIKPAF